MSKTVYRRHFLRRVIANIIDFFIVSILFSFLAVSLSAISGIYGSGPNSIFIRTCEKTDLRSAEEIRSVLGLDENSQTFSELCYTNQNFIQTVQILTYGANVNTESGQKLSLFVSFPVNDQGEKIAKIDASFLFVVLLVLIYAYILCRFKTTPGKKLVGLLVTQLSDIATAPTFKNAALRETVKFLPYTLISILSLYESIIFSTTSEAQLGDQVSRIQSIVQVSFFTPQVMIWLLVTLAYIVFVFGSFVIWRGQTWWDMAAGTVVRPNNEEVQTAENE